MASLEQTAPLLMLPSELRNAIYYQVFSDLRQALYSDERAVQEDNGYHASLTVRFDNRTTYLDASFNNQQCSRKLALLAACRQLHDEAYPMAMAMTPFHITGERSYPDLFSNQSRRLRQTKLGAIRYLTLTARISHLHALNERWDGLPFGDPSLSLDALILIPRRPDCSNSAYAEVADLSQSHTLAYILCETLKSLKNVKVVEVRNQGCFNDVVWRIVYRSLVYRTWRWGGETCGVKFEARPDSACERESWFRILFGSERGNEVGEEVIRLAGGQLPDPDTP